MFLLASQCNNAHGIGSVMQHSGFQPISYRYLVPRDASFPIIYHNFQITHNSYILAALERLPIRTSHIFSGNDVTGSKENNLIS